MMSGSPVRVGQEGGIIEAVKVEGGVNCWTELGNAE